jgi:hypothetical protein
MSDDDLISRIHQQAQGGRDAEVHHVVALFRGWLDAAHRFLAETRYNLPAIIASSEQLLEPLSIKHTREVGKGRKRTMVVEPEPAVGWELSTWDTYGGWNNDVHIYGRYYLLHDGRLLSAEKPQYSVAPPKPGDLIGDSQFLVKLAQEGERLGRRPAHEWHPAISKIRNLFERAGRTVPQLPPVPGYYGQGFKHLESYEWDELRRQHIR